MYDMDSFFLSLAADLGSMSLVADLEFATLLSSLDRMVTLDAV